MSYIAPAQNPHEAQYFTPGGGVAMGMARIPQVAKAIGEWEGGSAMYGKGLQMAEDFFHKYPHTVNPVGSEKWLKDWLKALGRREPHYQAGARMADTLEFSPTQTLGGTVPDRESLSRAINAAGGMNSPQVRRMLGFGQ